MADREDRLDGGHGVHGDRLLPAATADYAGSGPLRRVRQDVEASGDAACQRLGPKISLGAPIASIRIGSTS